MSNNGSSQLQRNIYAGIRKKNMKKYLARKNVKSKAGEKDSQHDGPLKVTKAGTLAARKLIILNYS